MLTLKRLLPLLGGAITAMLLVTRLAAGAVDAPAASPWISSPSLSFQKQADVSAIPAGANADCYTSATGECIYETNYGEANTRGSVRLRNSTSFYPVYSYIDNRQHYIPIPNSDGFFTYTTDAVYGSYLYYNYNFLSSAKLVPDGTSYDYRIVNKPDGKIVDSNQTRLAADTSSLGFSENGDWVVFSSPNVGLYRLNLQTLEAIQFALGFDYTKGLSPSPQTAVTNDGRYAAVASKDFSSFKLYDLAACSAGSTCQYRDLSPIVKDQISNFYAVSTLRFIDDDNLGLYASSYANGKYTFARYIVGAAGSLSRQDLLGLGDSYISGEGEFEYLPGTDTNSNKCHTSSLSYPLLLGQSLSFNSYHSVACSGATTNDVINTTQFYSGQTKPHKFKSQLSQSEIDSISSGFQPGYIDQLDFVRQYQPKSIILSIGGNDVNMIGKLKACIKPGTCFQTYEDRLEFVKDVNNTFPKLVTTYRKLKAAGPPDMRIYVVAYPQIAMPDGNCALNVHLDNDEIKFTVQAISYLDTIVKTAAAEAGVFYIDTEDAFYGHRFCEAGPGSVAMNGVTAGNDIPNRLGGPIGSESFHPNQFGHLLLENKILAATHNFADPMPPADPAASLPLINGLDILNAPHSDRSVNLPEFDPGLAPDLAYAGTPFDVTVGSSVHSLSAGSAFNSELHSDPIELGGLVTDSSGNINSQLTVPDDTPSGYHTLHFYGKDITGQPIDIYKDIYIAKTADDLDGNGIDDSVQKCIGIEASDQDFDKDGIDDACDGDITEPPVPANNGPSSEVISSPSKQSENLVPGPAIVEIKPSIKTSFEDLSTNPSEPSGEPQVLSASTQNHKSNNIRQVADARPQSSYYAAGGIGFLIISSLGYFFKRWWV